MLKMMKMKNDWLVLGMVVAMPFGASAALVVPGADGSDGALHVTEDTVIDLGLAATAVWDASYVDLAAADAEREEADFVGKGVYDAEKWAVVFRYSSVTVDAGATLTFKNHPRRAPVVWLVSGDVVVDGVVDVGGGNYVGAPDLSEPGPGGFRGGMAFFVSGVANTAGFGVGGGPYVNSQVGYGGSYGSMGSGGPAGYGNPSNVPLLGGSGGGGGRYRGGGGGAGAILVACEGGLAINGAFRANGGSGSSSGDGNYRSGGGSGGAIRLVCDTLGGTGVVQALGGGGYWVGGLGRMRIERVSNDSDLQLNPDPSVVGLADGAEALLWPPETAPTVKIVSLGSTDDSAVSLVADDPRAEFGGAGSDVVLPQISTVKVVVETTNVEPASQVLVRRTLRTNGNYAEAAAVLVDPEATTEPRRWVAELPVPSGFAAFQVRVVRP